MRKRASEPRATLHLFALRFEYNADLFENEKDNLAVECYTFVVMQIWAIILVLQSRPSQCAPLIWTFPSSPPLRFSPLSFSPPFPYPFQPPLPCGALESTLTLATPATTTTTTGRRTPTLRSAGEPRAGEKGRRGEEYVCVCVCVCVYICVCDCVCVNVFEERESEERV